MAANESRANKMSTLLEYNNFVLNDIRATVMPNFSVLLLFYSLRTHTSTENPRKITPFVTYG